jgi:hypothetical protein
LSRKVVRLALKALKKYQDSTTYGIVKFLASIKSDQKACFSIEILTHCKFRQNLKPSINSIDWQADCIILGCAFFITSFLPGGPCVVCMDHTPPRGYEVSAVTSGCNAAYQ